MAVADSNPQQSQLAENEEERRLKYLEFMHFATLHALMSSEKLYRYAKERSGPLKPGVNSVEGAVRTVVGPVYGKYQSVPIEVLKFFDRKVDESINKVQSRVPPTLHQAFETAQKAPAAARLVMSDVKKSGVVGTASKLAKTVYTKYEPTAKGLYTKYEPVAEQYAISSWRSLNQLPLFPRVAKVVAPTASYCSEMYNLSVQNAAEKGYKVASHLPLVPTERIAKALST